MSAGRKVISETRTLRLTHITRDPETGERLSTDITAVVRLEVDVDGLFEAMGQTCARSIGGKSVEAGGLVTFRRVGKAHRKPTGARS